jgi:putative radical SAM enzyme (TIGR03279 family)
MLVTHVNGVELRDMIDWDWEADGPEVDLEGVAYPGTPDEFEFECHLERDWGADWGLAFDGAVFDGMRICRNNCLFCFMKMLPKGMRRTLYMRDDDYRLSFLQGNFVTLTNMTDADVERVISHAMSPLNVSLHAVSPDIRARLIGKHAQRGLDVLERLLAGGIEVHAQIVLCPNENDGEELRRTLQFIEERPLITSLGIVPLGFTRHQDTFTESFNEPSRAQAVIDIVRPYQLRSRAQTGRTRYQLSDEFYLMAKVDPPEAIEYDGYPQYHDGIGMVRSFIDEGVELVADPTSVAVFDRACDRLKAAGESVLLLSGAGSAHVVQSFIDSTPVRGLCSVMAVDNRYFGGNVNVTGLLCACDVLDQLPDDLSGKVVLLPDIMLNTDRLTLDGMSADELLSKLVLRGARGFFVTSVPQGLKTGFDAL